MPLTQCGVSDGLFSVLERLQNGSMSRNSCNHHGGSQWENSRIGSEKMRCEKRSGDLEIWLRTSELEVATNLREVSWGGPEAQHNATNQGGKCHRNLEAASNLRYTVKISATMNTHHSILADMTLETFHHIRGTRIKSILKTT
jgi:hypothetical protein